MPKPCGHRAPAAGCRPCHLAATRPDYAALWGEPVPSGPAVAPRGSSHCGYRLRPTGAVVDCATCAGSVRLKVFGCALHGKCTLEQQHPEFACCADCPDHTARRDGPGPLREGGALPPAGELRRNLLYHVYPVSGNGAWQWNVARLCRSLHLFDGKVVVAVARDPESGRLPDPAGPHPPDGARHLAPCDTLDDVRRAFGPWADRVEFVEAENDPSLREVKTFLPLFERVESPDPREITLYAHAKGTTRHRTHRTAARWAEMLYEVFLDHWPLVEAHLRAWPVTGAFQKTGPGWSRAQSDSDWHYSGSWFAFRNAALFARPDWRRIDQFWSGIEPYPSQHFRFAEAGCLFHRGAVPRVNMYSPQHLRQSVEPALARWKARNAGWRTPPCE